MPRLTALEWRMLACIFESFGYEFDRMEGDHMMYAKAGSIRPLVIPRYKAVGLDIIQRLMKVAKITREEFFEALEKCK